MLNIESISDGKKLELSSKVLDILLVDKTTNKNIIWGTEDYAYIGTSFLPYEEITRKHIALFSTGLIQPRAKKNTLDQKNRSETKGEVFTPTWVCNEQNNLVDNAWFGKENVFNVSLGFSWKTTEGKIQFPQDKPGKSWENYIDERRLEITCGEAPYLVSRYDPTNGNKINLSDRIGLLDRKMRVVNENTIDYEDWHKWTIRAFQSVYGFEFQGDNLFLARQNLLLTFCEYFEDRFKQVVTERDLLKITNIIAWNLWQMDVFTKTIPYEVSKNHFKQTSLFDDDNITKKIHYCKIRNWRSNKTVEFINLEKG